jgi:hypothetical protein
MKKITTFNVTSNTKNMNTVERGEQKQWDEYKEKLEKFFYIFVT